MAGEAAKARQQWRGSKGGPQSPLKARATGVGRHARQAGQAADGSRRQQHIKRFLDSKSIRMSRHQQRPAPCIPATQARTCSRSISSVEKG